jgi:hypothetical protein
MTALAHTAARKNAPFSNCRVQTSTAEAEKNLQQTKFVMLELLNIVLKK